MTVFNKICNVIQALFNSCQESKNAVDFMMGWKNQFPKSQGFDMMHSSETKGKEEMKKLYICSDGTQFYDEVMCGQHIFCNPGVTCIRVEDV